MSRHHYACVGNHVLDVFRGLVSAKIFETFADVVQLVFFPLDKVALRLLAVNNLEAKSGHHYKVPKRHCNGNRAVGRISG